MRNSSRYHETPWLKRYECDCGCMSWFNRDDECTVDVCAAGLWPWRIDEDARLKVCVSKDPVRGAIRVDLGMTTRGDWLPFSFQDAGALWWWVEVEVK